MEDTLSRSGPGKAFTIGVIAALPALSTQTAGAAVASLAAKGVPAARTLLAAGLSGAILGPIIGLLGGILGAWCSIRNTNSPRERRFMIRMTVFVWPLLLALLGVPLTLAAINLRWTAWMHAYRQSSAYDPRNDVSLLTINLIVLGLFVVLLALFATQYVRHKAASKNHASNSRK